MRIGYLTSQYPMVSCTFITREIMKLRKFGFEIKTISINKPKVNFELDEEKQTFYIKEQGVWGAFSSFFRLLIKSPLKVLSGFRLACSLGIKSSFIFHLLYYVEAIIVADWVYKNNISHIHVHFMNNSSTVALLAKELVPVTISFTVHGPDSFNDVSRNFFKEKVQEAKFVVCISDFAKSQVMKLVPYDCWNKLHVIRLGINTEDYKPLESKKKSLHTELLCVGRLTPAKGQHLMIEALEALKAEHYNFHMTFVGDGPDYKSLKDLALSKGLGDSVTFTGALSEKDTKSYFQNSDIFILPSFAEGLPVVLMEAMAIELPCITTYVAGIPELIENGVNGVLVYPGNIEEIIRALKKLMLDSEGRNAIGRRARKKIVEQYSIDLNTAKLRQLFEAMLK